MPKAEQCASVVVFLPVSSAIGRSESREEQSPCVEFMVEVVPRVGK
jgi:hypothetical protein